MKPKHESSSWFTRLFLGLLSVGLALEAESLAAQEVQKSDQPAEAALEDSVGLPTAWQGHWQGEVTTWSGGREQAKFRMELHVQPTDDAKKMDWKIVYSGSAGRSERPYQLHVVNAKQGQYLIDEQNGIRLNASLLGDSLCFHFTTGGQRLWGSYRLDSANQQVVFELLTGADSQETRTGGGAVPEVLSLPTGSRQVAILQRVPPSSPADPANDSANDKR